MKINIAVLMAGTGAKSSVCGNWLQPLQAAMDKFEISSMPARVAAFLANIGVESNGLTVFEENLHYSAQGLANTWAQRYANDPHSAVKHPNQTAINLALGGPQRIANNVYANRMGNGPEMSGDGWRFRGQGPIQLTGRAMYTRCFEALGLPLDTDTSELQDPVTGALASAWFFAEGSAAMKAADAGNFSNVVLAINGQRPCPQNQGERREALYAACLTALKSVQATTQAAGDTLAGAAVHEAVQQANAPLPETPAKTPVKAAAKKGSSSGQSTT